jgi:hypothetical protein
LTPVWFVALFANDEISLRCGCSGGDFMSPTRLFEFALATRHCFSRRQTEVPKKPPNPINVLACQSKKEQYLSFEYTKMIIPAS